MGLCEYQVEGDHTELTSCPRACLKHEHTELLFQCPLSCAEAAVLLSLL